MHRSIVRNRPQSLLSPLVRLLLSVVAVVCCQAHADAPAEIAPIEAPFPMPQLERPQFPDRTFDIRDYGARETAQGGSFKNTDAIHRTIAAANRAGGGRVLIPAGDWLTGPVHLMDDINLHLDEGATLVFSTDREDYLPVVRQRHEGVEAYNYSPMIYGYELQNVAITGKGGLNGQGKHWWDWAKEYGPQPRAIATQEPLSRRQFGKGAGLEGMRPNFVVFWKSSNILVEGITLDDTPMWNLHFIYSEDIIVRDVTVNSLEAPNGDGLVVDSSKNVLIEYNHFETGDDAVVIKSGLNEEGLRINIPTENVVVRHFKAFKVRTGSGGVVFGSETSGGIRNIFVHDAYFDGTDRGIRFKTERGRGNIIENIFIRDIEMKDITYEAINFNTFYSGPGATGPSPMVRNIDIRNVTIDGVPTAISLIGLPEKWLEDIVLTNIKITNAERGARITRVKNLTLKDVQIDSVTRAMTVDDAYELNLDGVALKNRNGEAPLLLQGKYTGAILTDQSFPLDQIETTPEVPADAVNPARAKQAW